jgi:hypothetical protein
MVENWTARMCKVMTASSCTPRQESVLTVLLLNILETRSLVEHANDCS